MAEFNHSGEHSPRLTDWTKEPTLQELKLDWESAKQAHDSQIQKMERWNDLMKVTGKAKPKKIQGRSNVQPKLIRRQAEWRYSALTEPFLGSDKLYKLSPVTFEDKAAAVQNELLLNHQFRTQLNRVKFIDDYVRSTVDEGTSVIRVGWERVTAPVKTEVPIYQHQLIEDEEGLEQFKQVLALAVENPRLYKETIPPEVQAAVDYFEESQQATIAIPTGQIEIVMTEKVMVNKPTAEIMNPNNVTIDPSCGGDLDKAMFIGLTFETSKGELLKQGKRYKNLDRVVWDNAGPLSQPDHATSTPDNFNLANALAKKVVAYEYWGYHDIYDDGVLHPIVCTWIGNQLIRMELNPFPDGKLPFVVVPYLPVKRELYGEPDAELLEDNQAIAGAVARGMIDLLGRSANGQQGMAKGMLDPLNRRRYEQGQDYEFNPNVPIQNGLIEHKFPEVPQSALTMLGLQNQEAESLTGVKSFSGGISGEAYGKVASNGRSAIDAASKREMAILRRLAMGIVQLGNKIIAMNAVFLSEEEVVRITNDEFVTIRREDLGGNFDLIVDISTAEVDEAQAQDLGFMLQTIGPDMDPELRQIILGEIARLKRMPDLEQKIVSYQPQPDPLAEKIKELQVQELELKIAKLKSEVGLNEAKTELAAATADKTNLEFVEQETGTAHARNMEQNRGQAQGNIDLEITKAIVKPRKEGEKPGDIEAAVGFSRIANKRDNEGNIGGDRAGLPIAPAAPQPPMMDPAQIQPLPELAEDAAFSAEPDLAAV